MAKQNKLIIVDGNSIFYRSFYALPLLKNPKGQPCNAIYGFFIELVKIIQNYQPTHLAVAFDKSRSKLRSDLYSEYKANRKKAPDELLSQLTLIRECLDVAGVKHFAIDGVEGDDVVGSLARRFEKECETFIISSDRDLFQLISEHTKMLYVKKGMSDVRELDPKALCDLMGFAPSHVVDIKALAGDTSDNIPGVEGIGEKSAIELVTKYGSIENILSNIDEIKPRQKTALLGKEDVWQLCRKLATIYTDAPLGDVTLNDLVYTYPFNQATKEMFTEFGFRTLINKPEIFASGDSSVGLVNVSVDEVHERKLVNTMSELVAVLSIIKKEGECAVYFGDELEIFAGGNAFTVKVDFDMYREIACKVLSDKNIRKFVLDNRKAREFVRDFSCVLEGEIFDFMIADHLRSGRVIKSEEDVIAKHSSKDRIIFDLIPLCQDAEKDLKDKNLYDLYVNVELPLSEVLDDMSVQGFKVKCGTFVKLNTKVDRELESLSREICKMCGVDFNIRSPKQLADVLFGKLGLPNGSKGSTSIDVLEWLEDKHPVIPLIIRHRKLGKFMGTYLDGFLPYISEDGFVHTIFNQTMTNTGRLSSSEPNLQNIPVRSEDSQEIRALFCPRSLDHVLIDADYSQIELRLLAAFSGDEQMIDAFAKGRDIHTETASSVFGVKPELVTSQMRRIAKVVNFGIIYGISGFGLAQDLKITPKQAKAYIDSFFELHPKVKEYMDKVISDAKSTGKVYTMLGRFRNIDAEINSHNFIIRSGAERAAQNMPLQGSAADIIKMAMINVYKRLRREKLEAKLICQVHDELVIDAPKSEEEKVKKLLKEEMENVVSLAVPLEVEVSSGSLWQH